MWNHVEMTNMTNISRFVKETDTSLFSKNQTYTKEKYSTANKSEKNKGNKSINFRLWYYWNET